MFVKASLLARCRLAVWGTLPTDRSNRPCTPWASSADHSIFPRRVAASVRGQPEANKLAAHFARAQAAATAARRVELQSYKAHPRSQKNDKAMVSIIRARSSSA
jgi:hypothetical protein